MKGRDGVTTPICDYVKKYAEGQAVRLHMPGHKGESFLGLEKFDITEIEGADVLYSPAGIIAESQKNASALFGTEKTLYSTEGSSLCIRAMLRIATATAVKGERPWVLAARNAHKAFLSACALLDADVEWMYPEKRESILSCKVTAEDVERGINSREQKPCAVYLTSPDYLGNVCDIKEIADVCHKFGVPLLVDNAHGAYLGFLEESRHPIALGADMCCDSAHKTLPVLTGGAYLHISKNAPAHLCDGAEQAMELFASTSPSYLILQSLDKANAYICDGYKERLAALISKTDKLKKALADKGITFMGDEPLKLTIAPKSYGYTGAEFAKALLKHDIVCEFSDPDFCVMMLTPEIKDEDFDRLENALLGIERKTPIAEVTPTPSVASCAISIREAMLALSEEIDVEKSAGRILASPCVSCPPAVPILVCGEKIDRAAIECFGYYGITKIRVVK